MAKRHKFLVLAGLAALACAATFTASRAADVAEGEPPPVLSEDIGVVCTLDNPWRIAASAATLPWPSVWYGHFSGGRPYDDGSGRVLVDWRDERVCFASRERCQAWVDALRRVYHDPEGYWTCLFLR